jgi:hypothetical protein
VRYILSYTKDNQDIDPSSCASNLVSPFFTIILPLTESYHRKTLLSIAGPFAIKIYSNYFPSFPSPFPCLRHSNISYQMWLLVALGAATASNPRSKLDLAHRRFHRPTTAGLHPRRNAWYRVHFSQKPDIRALAAQGITLTARSYVSPKDHVLYLTLRQVRFLARVGTLSEVSDKIMPSDHPLHRAPFLHIETAPSFDPSVVNDRIRRHSLTHYTVIFGAPQPPRRWFFAKKYADAGFRKVVRSVLAESEHHRFRDGCDPLGFISRHAVNLFL